MTVQERARVIEHLRQCVAAAAIPLDPRGCTWEPPPRVGLGLSVEAARWLLAVLTEPCPTCAQRRASVAEALQQLDGR